MIQSDRRDRARHQRAFALTAQAHAGDHLALVAEQIFGDVPALVFLMDAVRLGHLHIVHEGFAEGRIAADQQDRLGRDAGALHVEQHEADAALLGCLAGADEAEDPVGLIGVAGPHLLPVDDVMIARVLGAGREAGEVGPGVRFGIALAPADLAAGDLGQMVQLLLFAAVFQQRRPEHRNAEAVQRVARPDRAHFFAQHLGFRRRQPATAIFLRPIGDGPAAFAHHLQPLRLRRVGIGIIVAPTPADVLIATDRLAHVWRAVRLQPRAGVGSELIEIGHHWLQASACAARAAASAVRS